jgi:diguanylate cyclase (GGDEF)-like protein
LIKTLGAYQKMILGLLAEIREQRDQNLRLATHDHLTGLPTPRLFEDRLEMAVNKALRAGSGIALLFVDLDGFKAINDTFGHAAGDSVLREVAARLSNVVRNTDTVARIGGDEFALLLTEQADRDSAAVVAGRLLEAIRAPVLLDQEELQVDASIGISLYPDHAMDIPTLRDAADRAMYRVKGPGRRGFAFADSLSLQREEALPACLDGPVLTNPS